MGSLTSSRVVLNWIDGKWVGTPDIRQSINPATYEVIGEYADGGSKPRTRPSKPPNARSAKRPGRARADRGGLRAQPKRVA